MHLGGFHCTEAVVNHVFYASQGTSVDISGKVTSTSTSSSSGGTGSSSSSSSSTATGEETSPYGNYDSYGDYTYEGYDDETTPLPDGDTSRRVTISTDSGAKLDLELKRKTDPEPGTGKHISTSEFGTSITINQNKTKLVSGMAASSPSPVDQ